MEDSLHKLVRKEISLLFEAMSKLERAEERAEYFDKELTKTREEYYNCRRFYHILRDTIINAYEGEVPVSPQIQINKIIELINRSEEFDL